MIKIYNSLTSKKEEFKPLVPGIVNMYVCGPTVYDISHIGHLRAAYVFDVIRCYMEYCEYLVTVVRNVTDIDDKIINRARNELIEGENLNQKVKEIARKYNKLYEDDMSNFGIKSPDVQPKATEHIPDMIAMIMVLIEKGIAYESEGGVYFSVRSFPSYGKLSHQSIDQMMDGVRKVTQAEKRDPLDFALWKKVKGEEPSWESPWGSGRPGWHIECSAVSTKHFKGTFDIHGGGRDLIFPHHENEIAQAEAATDKPFVNYWIHNGLLTVDKEKMAKSLGNFVTIEDILNKYHPDVIKIFFLQAHYSSTIDFSWEKIEEAKKAYERITIFLDKLKCLYRDIVVPEISKVKEVDSFKDEFMRAMDDDFNTARGLAVLFEMVTKGNKLIDSDQKDKDAILFELSNGIKEFSSIFGMTFSDKNSTGMSDEDIRGQVQRRAQCKKEKKFKEADAIRGQLQLLGIILEDTRDGMTTWRIK